MLTLRDRYSCHFPVYRNFFSYCIFSSIVTIMLLGLGRERREGGRRKIGREEENFE